MKSNISPASNEHLNSEQEQARVDPASFQPELESLREKVIFLQNRLADKEKIIAAQKRKALHLFQQVDSLNIKLSEIFSSEGWKLLLIYYRIREKLLPSGSPRHTKLKAAFNRIRGKKDEDFLIQDHTLSPGTSHQWEIPIQIENFDFPLFSQPKVSIIIPAYNGWEVNYRCLRSIWENTDGISYEVIFADDVSTDETQHVDRYINNIVHIRNEKNLGFLQNCNHAARFAKGEYLHFLNNDTVVTEDWLSSLASLMDKDKTIGMAGSKLIYPDGRLQEAGGIIWQDASGWNYGHKQGPDASEFNYVKEVDYISGASIMIRKSLWDKLGGFDELYAPAYYEDTDLAFEVRKQGFKVVYQPLSKIVHFEGYSHGSDQNKQGTAGNVKQYQQLNKEKFFNKWKEVLSREHFPNAQDVFWARDRSKGRKTILVIDHYVPHFDKDAGSRHTYQYLQLLVELNFNVKFMGDNFYRHEPYTTALQQMGIEVLYGQTYVKTWKSWITDNKSKIDYSYLHRPHVAVKYIDFIKDNTDSKILYFGHDLHFYREGKQYEIEKDPDLAISIKKWKEIETSIFEKSDIILTPSEKERQIIAGLSADFNVSAIPLYYVKEEKDAPKLDFSDRKNILFVGGFRHKPNLDAVVWFIKDVWPLIKAAIQEIQFIIVGSNVPDEVKQLAGPDIIIKGYISDPELETLYQQIRMVVIPLRYGGGIKGKTLEAMQNGIPIVTTPEGVEGLSGDISFINPVEDAISFASQVVNLYSSDSRLMELSARGISYIQENFNHSKVRSIFAGILSSE